MWHKYRNAMIILKTRGKYILYYCTIILCIYLTKWLASACEYGWMFLEKRLNHRLLKSYYIVPTNIAINH